MAMGQGEQRAIHPFFRKDFGVPAPRDLPVGNGLIDSTDSHKCNCSPASQTPSVAVLDHDPNADRRKRRRTATSAAEPSGNDAITIDDEAKRNDSNNPTKSENIVTLAQTPGKCASVQIPPPSQEEEKRQELFPDNANNTLDRPDQKKQKVIKLNANGKLLSSPVADKFADKPKARRSTRGKPALRHTEGPERKIVVIKYNNIKYNNTGGSSESLGQQIDGILCGRARHTTSKRTVAPVTIVPKATPKPPAKPPHPFFLKKALPKSDASSSLGSCQYSSSTPSADGQTSKPEQPHFQPTPKPLLSFKHTFPRVPEPAHPLWPPLGLTHVRNLDDNLGLCDDDYSPETDRRKSKSPAIQINDDESVLSFIKHSTRDVGSILRLPRKQVTSGQALQAEMHKRLMGLHGHPNSDEIPAHDTLQPAIAKLYASLPTSMTPFDRGEYEAQSWAQKYAPTSAQQVLCATKEALMLRDWLKNLVVSSVGTGNSWKDNEKSKQKEEKKRKRRKRSENLDGFIVSSEDEASEMGEISGSDDELAGDVTVSNKRTVIRTGDLTFNLRSSNERGHMANAVLLSGPPGCGKTASVYAVAKEMDFEVFEINAGQRRSARDILDRVGDMTQNHLVHRVHNTENHSGSPASATNPQAGGLEDAIQNKLMGFLKPTLTAQKTSRPKAKASRNELDVKQSRSQKQSLILLEEADILFEEDKQFWSGVLTLINQSRRPIIITCNDETLVPLDNISFHAILRYKAPAPELAVDYLLLVAANEGHILKRTALEKLYLTTGNDLRKSLTELNYWCQMAVGSEKSGLDWIIDRWSQGVDLNPNGDKLRVLSEDTYVDCMGWFSRDISMGTGLPTETELREEALHWWQLSLQDADSMEDSQRQPLAKPSPTASRLERLDALRQQSDYMESRSVFDVLAAASSLDAGKDSIDTSIPPISENQKLNYVEGYQLLHADHIPSYTTLTVEIGSTFQALLGRVFRQPREVDTKNMLATMVLEDASKPKAAHPQEKELLEALMPVMKPDCSLPPPKGGAQLSFEYGHRSIAEDLTPYIRAIVAFDLRLEQYRRDLNRLLSGSERGTKRMRTTRASRAALEGGNKAETRKERWFSPAVNVQRVLATAKREWQELLVQNGYFTVPVAGEQAIREGSEPISGSASDGSI